MSMLELIEKRRSYRGEFVNEPVPREDLEKIMRAGLAAPSGSNKQSTSLIAVDDPELVAKLRAVINRPRYDTTPAFICVISQEIIAYDNKHFAVQDYSAAIENMLLEITELGYAGCWIEGPLTDPGGATEEMAKILGVPEGYRLVCFTPVGKPVAEVAAPAKKEFGERAWFNGFGK